MNFLLPTTTFKFCGQRKAHYETKIFNELWNLEFDDYKTECHFQGSWWVNVLAHNLYFSVFNWSIVVIQCYISFRSTARWFNISIHCKVITVIKLAMVCHHIKLLHIINYIPYALHCIPVSYVLYNWKYVPFESLPNFVRFPLPSSNHQIVLYIYMSVSVLFL